MSPEAEIKLLKLKVASLEDTVDMLVTAGIKSGTLQVEPDEL